MHWYEHVHLHVCAHPCDCAHETYMFVICMDFHVALNIKVLVYHLAHRVKINCQPQGKKKFKMENCLCWI